MSRCAIAAWASRTWAFDSANFLPPLRPRARAALSPATVRSRISSRSSSANAAKMPKHGDAGLADLLIEVENDLGFSVHFQQPGEKSGVAYARPGNNAPQPVGGRRAPASLPNV